MNNKEKEVWLKMKKQETYNVYDNEYQQEYQQEYGIPYSSREYHDLHKFYLEQMGQYRDAMFSAERELKNERHLLETERQEVKVLINKVKRLKERIKELNKFNRFDIMNLE